MEWLQSSFRKLYVDTGIVLKQARTDINVLLRRLFELSFSLYAPITSDMLDFICMWSVKVLGTGNKQK